MALFIELSAEFTGVLLNILNKCPCSWRQTFIGGMYKTPASAQWKVLDGQDLQCTQLKFGLDTQLRQNRDAKAGNDGMFNRIV